MAEQCYSNPSSWSGWQRTEVQRLAGAGLLYQFNITMPKLDVTNDIDYVSVQPEEALTPLLARLKQQRILIHGSGFFTADRPVYFTTSFSSPA